jgi:hypothetical protein
MYVVVRRTAQSAHTRFDACRSAALARTRTAGDRHPPTGRRTSCASDTGDDGDMAEPAPPKLPPPAPPTPPLPPLADDDDAVVEDGRRWRAPATPVSASAAGVTSDVDRRVIDPVLPFFINFSSLSTSLSTCASLCSSSSSARRIECSVGACCASLSFPASTALRNASTSGRMDLTMSRHCSSDAVNPSYI